MTTTVTFDETLYKLVPIEPTEEMSDAAAWTPCEDGRRADAEAMYKAMLSVAPSPVAAQSEEAVALKQIEELSGIAIGSMVKGPDEDGDHWCQICDAMLEDELSGHKATCASRTLRDIFDIASRPSD